MARGNDTARRALRLEAVMLARWIDAELDHLRRGDVTEAEAAERVAGYIWSFRVGRAIARRGYR